MMGLIQKVRKTGFTLAPEAGSERLRRVINKEILDKDLFVAVDNAYQLGWRVLKLYFMTGLPTEREEDLEALVELCNQVWELGKKKRAAVNVSVTGFVPKPQTPFQWFAQVPREQVLGRLDFLKARLKRPGMRLKWHHPDHSVLEAVFARGDRRLGEVLKRAWELGARFDGWTEYFRQEVWDQAFSEAGLHPEFYANRERSRDEVLPWDHLSTRVERDYLWKEYERAKAEEFTADCRWNRCTNCGVCDHQEVAPRLHRDAVVDTGAVELAEETSRPEVPGYIYWFRYSKVGNIRFIGQLEVAQIFSRAIRRTGLPAAYTKGFHPHVKLSFDEALPLGMESMAEEARLTLIDRIDPEDFRQKLNGQLPDGLHIEQAARMGKPLPKSPYRRVVYRVFGLGTLTVRSLVNNWKQRVDEPLVKKTKKGELHTTLGGVVLDLRAGDEGHTLEMDLYEGPQFCFRPAAVLERLLGESAEETSGMRIMKIAVFHLPAREEGENVCRTHSQC
jgi:radical SAM-linked protein